MNTFQTRCPIVKRTQEMLNQWTEVGGEWRRVDFTREIVWLQESESEMQFLHGGNLIKEGSLTNDFYGYLTSCDDNSPSPELEATRYGITRDSSLDLVVKTTVFIRPAMELKEMAEHNRDLPDGRMRKYAEVPNGWRIESMDDDGDRVWSALERVNLGSAVVWSSKNTDEKNAGIKAAFKAKWAIIEQPAQVEEPAVNKMDMF